MNGIKREWRTEDGAVTLYQGDCREILPHLQAESIDAVITDPPYGIVNQFGENTGNGTRTMQFEWDTVDALRDALLLCRSTASAFVFAGFDTCEIARDALRVNGFVVKPAAWVKECPPPAGHGNDQSHRQLKTWITGGYPCVALRLNGRTIRRPVHRLIAEAFIGPCPAGEEVCHRDGVRTNCAADNLRYGTRKSNLADREQHGTAQRGERNPAATLSNSQAEELKAMRANGVLLRVIAEKFGVRESTVSRIANGVRRA